MISDALIEAIQTRDESLNVSIVRATVIPASNPPVPGTPVIPPSFENITQSDNITLTQFDEPRTLPQRAQVSFIVPSGLAVTREPYNEVIT